MRFRAAVAPPRSVGREENKPTAANQASYGTDPQTATVPPVTGRGAVSLHAASLPGRKGRGLFDVSTRLVFESPAEDASQERISLAS